ncbi:MAG: hypothetical protein E7K67_13705 [Peptostreptococcaceae bacterium]|nr:hypothetical protein [Peptostreptococcaceae bacterium]
MSNQTGIVELINGPVVKGSNMQSFKVNEMVTVGRQKLIGEVVSLEKDKATIQVFEETEGLMAGEEVYQTGAPLSLTLVPGMLGNMFDGIQRPLKQIEKISKNFIPEGIGLISIDPTAPWEVNIVAKEGDYLMPGSVYATVQETLSINHKIMVPPDMKGKVVSVKPNGIYTLNDTIVQIELEDGTVHNLTLAQKWPVRKPRPIYI